LDVAVIVNEPLAPAVSNDVTTPAETVAIAVLLETHVATVVTSWPPLHEAVNNIVSCCGERLPLVGLMTGALVQATATVSGWVPVTDGRMLDVAVIVPVPTACADTSPLLVIVATF
jgi:hypothetical protein